MRALFFTLLLVGCTKQNPDFCPNHTTDPRCGGMGSNDGGVDADGRNPGIDARLDFGAGNYSVHVDDVPAMSVISFDPGANLNTDTSSYCLQTQPTGWMGAGQPAS